MSQNNSYQNLKLDFKKDTGLDADENIAIYIQYYNARINDLSMKYLFQIQQLLNTESNKGMPDTLKNQLYQLIDLNKKS